MKPDALLRRFWIPCLFLAACAGSSSSPGGDATPDGVVATELPDAVTDVAADPSAEAPGDVVEIAAELPGDALDTAPDANPPKPFLSARKVAVPADLVGGDDAWGVVGGAYLLENSTARFLVQDKGAAVHLYIYGGNLIDADLHREAGEPGNDQFREMFPIVGWRVNSVDKVEVIKDGTDGQEAVVRVTGRDTDTGMIQMIDDMASPLGVTIATDYVLAPDQPWLKLRTTATTDPGAMALSDLMTGDFLSFGGPEKIFVPEGGLTATPGTVSAIVGQGRGASYGYTYKGPITVPMVDASGTLSILASDFAVPGDGGSASFERYFVLGTDIASAMDGVYAIRGTAVHALKGQVVDPDGKGIAGARVSVFAAGGGTVGSGAHMLDQAIAGTDGTFAMTVPPAKYDLVFSAPGRLRRVAQADVTAGDVVDVKGQLPAAGTVTFQAHEVDGTGAALGNVPAKASFYCNEGAESPWDEIGEHERYGLCQVIFSVDGKAFDSPIKPGHYQVVVSRGIEYEQFVIDDLAVAAGTPAAVSAGLFRSVDSAGWITADFHQHTTGSIDAEVTHVEKVIENLDEGVEVAAMTDHDNMTSYTPSIQKLGVGALITSLDGDEVSVNQVGHFNVFAPTGKVIADDGTAGDLMQYVGAKLFAHKTVPEVFAAIRKIPGLKAIQVNHPRSGGNNGYFQWLQYNPVVAKPLLDNQPMAWDFDTIEVSNAAIIGQLGQAAQFLASSDAAITKAASASPADIPTLMDWFSVLNLGRTTCATGDSDAHDRNDGVGYTRNFLRAAHDQPGTITTAEVLDAVLAQRNVVSNGPFLRITVGGVERMGHLEVVTPTAGKVTVHLNVQAPLWMTVPSFEVYANGRPVSLKDDAGVLVQDDAAPAGTGITTTLPLAEAAAGKVVRLDADVTLAPAVDTWYVFVVKGTSDMSPVGRGVPFAFTNPLYVDVDGGGFKAINQPAN